MNLLANASGGTLIEYLFGGSVSIMGVFMTMVGLDLTNRYVKALKNHTWVSSINLYGLFTKFITFSTIICTATLDKITPIVGITLPINVALIWTALLIVYEVGSILENAREFELKITWLQKWLRIFERDVGKKFIKTIKKTMSDDVRDKEAIWKFQYSHISNDHNIRKNGMGAVSHEYRFE